MCPASPQSITRWARLIPGAGHVRPFVHIHHATDRPAVNAHADLQARVVLERPADLKGALRRFLRTPIEHQRHAVASGDFKIRLAASAFWYCSDKRTIPLSSSTLACCSLTESFE